ncbi:MAG: hypothetical protein EX272_07020 [Chromatiales bacterium]|nr:MAG: hypothetical protein EX272_07020 [Chromatiales bacterium]
MREFRLPYPGLRAFDREEADLFFGRDGAVDDMIDRLAGTRFLAVLGASGSGKSSLVKTGLLDGLELGLHPAGPHWQICTFTPGGGPFRNLATALYELQQRSLDSASSNTDSGTAILEGFLRQGPRSLIRWIQDGYLPEGHNLLLLVDQFEELFRYGGYSEREDAEAFVKLLIESTSAKDVPIHCVLTMRSEFLGACALIPGLAETINAGAYLTPRMSRSNCREAIVGPARMSGVEIENSLVNRLLNDLIRFAPWEGDEDSDQAKQLARRADQLPVMQHLLNRIWQHASDAAGDAAVRLTEQDYEALGGLSGALDAHGAELLERFDEDEKILVERIFRALVDGTSPATATRRPLRFSDIVACTDADEEAIRRVIDMFRADDCNFLRPGPAVTLRDETIVDISHESLIRQWSVLSDWVTAEARAANLWRRLSTSAGRYQRQEGELLAGLDLANLSAWWDEEKPQPSWTSRYSDDFDAVSGFVQKSVEAERERERARQDRELRERKRLRIGLASVTALAIAASVLAYWAFHAENTIAEINLKAAVLRINADDDFLAAMDEGQKAPISERYAEIQQRGAETEGVTASLEDEEQVLLRRAIWLTRTADMLLDAGWVREGAERTAALEELVIRNARLFTSKTSAAIYADALAAIARGYTEQGEYDRANARLDQAESALGTVDDADFAALRRHANVLYRRSEVALGEERYAVFLRSVDALRNIYREVYDVATEAARQKGSAEAVADIELTESPGQLDSARVESDPERLTESPWQLVSALQESDREHARDITEMFARAQMRAVSVVHNIIASSARGESQLDELVAEVDKAFRFYAAIEQEEATGRRALSAFIARTTADYYLDTVENRKRSLARANEAVAVTAGLLIDDPGDLGFRSQFVMAQIQRAQALSQLGKTDEALAGLRLARRVVFDTKLKRPPGPLWRAHDRSISFNQYRVQEQAGSPEKGQTPAWRLKAEVDYAAQSREDEIDEDAVFPIWALVTSGAVNDIPRDRVVPYLQWLLDLDSQARPEFEDDYARRRLRSWGFSQALSLPIDMVGEDTWKTWFEQARVNGVVDDASAQDYVFGLAVFRSMPVPLAGHIPSDHALLAKRAIEDLDELKNINEEDDAQALARMKRAFAEIVVPDGPRDAQLAYMYLLNAIAAKMTDFASTDDAMADRLEVLNAAIAVNEAPDEGGDEAMLMLNYLVGTRAAALQKSGDDERAIADYSHALKLAENAFEANSKSRANLRNSIFYARKILDMTTADGSASAPTLARLDRLFSDILPAYGNRRLLAESRSYLTSLERSIKARQRGASAVDPQRLEHYLSTVTEALARTDPDSDAGGLSDDAGVEAGGDAASLSGDGPERVAVTERANTDFRKLYSVTDVGDSGYLNWSREPLYPGSWRTMFDEERDALLNRLPAAVRDEAEHVRVLPLPFYEDGRLVEVERNPRDGEIAVRTYLAFPDSMYSLNGTSPPIHEANRKAPILLETRDQAAAYLRFFSMYVNGKEGAFFIVDNGNEIEWRATAEESRIEDVRRRIRPLVVWPDEQMDRHWQASATVQYNDALFGVIFRVYPTGMVEMLSDAPLAADLPIDKIVISNRGSGVVRETDDLDDLDDLGIIAVASFKDEVVAIMRKLDEAGPEDLDHVLEEYAFYLQDKLFLATHEDADVLVNGFAYNLAEHEVRLDDAKKLALIAHELDSDNPDIKDTYAWALIKNGAIDEGIEVLLEAGKIYDAKPGSDFTMLQYYAHLGHAYRISDQADLAREALEKALAYDVPGDWLDFANSELQMLDQTAP